MQALVGGFFFQFRPTIKLLIITEATSYRTEKLENTNHTIFQ